MSLNFFALEQQIEARMKAGHVPGFALAIVQDQKVIYVRGFGYTAVENNVECGLPVTPQTLFRIGSVSKSLTGVAVMRLVEAGKLDLDTPVKNYIPWLKFSEAGAVDSVTLRMLMSHTSGLGNEWDYPGRRDPTGLEAYGREMIPQFPLVAPPGKLYSYSGPGISLVGYIAEVVSGMNYTQLMQELVFDPLDMKRTTFDPTVAMTYPLAQSHDLSADGILTVQHQYIENVGQYPETSANSTVLDLANFCMMQMNQGCFDNVQILSPVSVAEMQRVQVDEYTLNGAGYGLTLGSNQYKGVWLVGHGGLMSTHFTNLVMAPDSRIAIIAVGNRWSIEFTSGEFMNGLLDQLLNLPAETVKPQAIEPDKSLWGKYTGSYLGNWMGLAKIQVCDDQLLLDWNGEVIPLKALKDHFYFGQKPDSEAMVPVGFITEESGSTQYIMLNGEPGKCIEYEIAPVSDIDGWAAYAGQYLGVFGIMTTCVEGDRFVIYAKEFGVKSILIPLGKARFASQLGIIEFQASQEGVVHALIIGDHITFSRVGENK
jgi:CubicO group peptidase (beta-lactamase class C family)